MKYVNLMESTFDKLEAGDRNAMSAALSTTVDDLSALIRMTQSNLSKSDRQRIMCTITLDAHGMF